MIAQVQVTAAVMITEFLEGIRQDLINDLATKNRNATGKTSASIQVVNVTANSGQLVGNDNVLYTFQGRGPGKMPPLSNIIDWCYARGLPRAVAWIIAKRISEAGTELYRKGAADNNELKTALSADRIKAFTDKIKTIYTAAIKSDLQTLINNK